jgi:hypothetical protein|tara:strand:- start:405 stop:875 length:471 start_codon:yes stop_codon:yes gene_type:complete
MVFIKGSDGIARSLKENKDVTYRYADSNVATFLPTNVANVGAANVNSGNLIATGQVVSTGNVSGVNLVINTISSDDSTFVVINDGLDVKGDLESTGDISGATVTATNSVKMAVYADDAARNTGIPSPIAGQMVFKTDIAKLQFYNGSAWETVTSAV